jgi:hypothetical protein
MKKVMISAFAVGLCMTASVYSQNNCNLINSVTLNAPSNKFIGAVSYAIPNLADGGWDDYSDCELLLNNWIYIAYSKDQANNMNLYINGNLIKSGAYQNFPYSWNSLRLGTDLPSSANNFFNGKIDELRISNVVRSASEISQYFNSNQPFIQDQSTIALYDFNQQTGGVISASFGPNGTNYNSTFESGLFGNSISFNGVNSYADFPLNVPESNLTVEFWINITNIVGSDWVINYPGIYGAGFEINNFLPSYSWSTGSTGNTITIDPSQMQYVWVTDGNCTDTVWFDSQSATVYDTLYTTVTDTLIINTTLSLPAPNNENTILIYPNPASDHITIDNGNYTAMAGYSIKIENNAGQQVFQSLINQAQFYVDLSTWTGNGLYFVHLIDPQNNTVTVRKIVLQ